MPSDPIFLGFDTSAAHCAAALLSGGEVLGERREAMARGQAERLFPLIEALLAETRIGWRDLAAIGVGTGPGNFTGLRIAVSAARGLAVALGRPAIGVTGFEAQALGRPRPLLSALDAPCGQVYLQRLDAHQAGPARLVPAEAARDEADRMGLPLLGGPFDATRPEAHAIARIAAAELAAGAVLPRPAPFYVRPPDAAPARGAAPALMA